MDFKALQDFVKYTMVLALAGLGFAQATITVRDTLFFVGPEGATILMAGATLFFFAASFVAGLFFLSGMAGLATLDARKEDFEKERAQRDRALDRGNQGLSKKSREEQQNERDIETYRTAAQRNANWHFGFLGVAYVAAAILFFENLIDGPDPAQSCSLSIVDGQISVPVTCVGEL